MFTPLENGDKTIRKNLPYKCTHFILILSTFAPQKLKEDMDKAHIGESSSTSPSEQNAQRDAG